MAGNQNSGRKTLEEEIRVTKEKIKQEALVELANRVMFKRLTALEETDNVDQEKDFALPITLKGMTEKNETTLNLPKPILDVFQNNSHDQNTEPKEENQNLSGGNIGE